MKNIVIVLLVFASLAGQTQLHAGPKPRPGTKPPPSGGNEDYFGGPKAWYQSGYSLGKKDRKAGLPPNPERHKEHFDKITASEFRRGYMEAYQR
ncbi:MAG: hypothetical protein K1X78_04540 [Verrucomicrobiaceae bacterium]|nr:hypothetical protein [Verrucomicrobiaceae bacterium]